MPELGPYGSVRGARGNSRPYREPPDRASRRLEMTLRTSTTISEDLNALGSFELPQLSIHSSHSLSVRRMRR